MSRVQLNEGTANTLFKESDNKPSGVLKVVTGCVADFKPNRNGRTYPKELWSNVINSEYVQEMMKAKTLFGEADHPETRTELSLQNVSHAINKLWIDEDKQEVWAEMHILPTPLGEMIANLIEYGSHIGVSSRGAGSVLSDGTVDPDDYQFFTFDLVARPSVAAARPELVESEQIKEPTILTESETACILDSYRNIGTTCKKLSEESQGFSYLQDNKVSIFNNKIINDLIKESEEINKK